MSCNGGNSAFAGATPLGTVIRVERKGISKAYMTNVPDRPLTAITIRTAAGDSRRGWLTAGGRTIPVALGRGGIRADKREGDGGTPRGTFRPRQLWWRARAPPG